MKMKKICPFVAGYVLGSVLVSVFSKKSGTEIRKDMEEAGEAGECPKKVLLNNYVDTHKTIFEGTKELIMSEKNKKMFKEKVGKVKETVETYKKDGKEAFNNLKDKGEKLFGEANTKIGEFYDENKSKVDKFKKDAVGKIKNTKDEVVSSVKDFSKKKEEK